MSELNKLLDKAVKFCSPSNDAGLAKRLDVSRAAVSRWRHDLSAPDATSCAQLSEITGEPLARVLGVAGEARAISAKEKAVWRRLASAACLVLAFGQAGVTWGASALRIMYIFSVSKRNSAAFPSSNFRSCASAA